MKRQKEFDVSLLTLLEPASLQLLIFGSAIQSLGYTIVWVLFYSLLRTLTFVAYNYLCFTQTKVNSPKNLHPTTVYTDMRAGSILRCLAAFFVQTLLYVLFFQVRWQNRNRSHRKRGSLHACFSFVQLTEETLFSGEYDSVWRYYLRFLSSYTRPSQYLCCDLRCHLLLLQKHSSFEDRNGPSEPDLM